MSGRQGRAFNRERGRAWLQCVVPSQFLFFPSFIFALYLKQNQRQKQLVILQRKLNTKNLILLWHEIGVTLAKISSSCPHTWGWCVERNGAWRGRHNDNSASTCYTENGAFHVCTGRVLNYIYGQASTRKHITV